MQLRRRPNVRKLFACLSLASTVLKKLLIALAVIVVLLVGLGVVGWVVGSRFQRPGDGAGAGLEVRAEDVTRRPITVRVSAPGRLEAKENVQISARVSARIAELPFEEGDRVEAGDTLVRLDDTDLAAALRARQATYAAQQVDLGVAEARLRASRARLAADDAILADARRDLNRKVNLFESKDISQADVEAAQVQVDRLVAELESAKTQIEAEEANLGSLRFRLEVAQAEIDLAQDALEDSIITSPIAGVVTRVNAEVGELVVTGTMNNAGTVIMEVADLDTMLVVTQIDEADIADVRLGQAAEITIDAYSDTTFAGEVTNVALARMSAQDLADMGGGGGNSNSYKVEVLLDKQGVDVLTDLTADVEILAQTFDDPLTVPTQAILGYPVDDLSTELRELPEVRRGKTRTPVVYRVEGGKAVVTPVKVGESDLEHTILESGVAEGDRVVTGPFSALEQLADDKAVRVEGEEPTPATDEADGGANE